MTARAAARPDRPVAIESLGVYLPDRVVTTAEVLAGCRVSHQLPLERVTGIRSRRVAAPGQFAVDLAGAAIADCLARSQYLARDIDLLISASLSHYDAPGRYHSYEPATALRLKAQLGFDRAVAFDVSNGCAGLWTALCIAEALIANGEIRCALLVSGEFISDLIRTAQLEIASYFDPQIASLTVGDSGVALTLEAGSDPEKGLQALDLYTIARYAPYCITRPTPEPHGGGVMVTDSLRIGARSIEHVAAHLADTLRDAGWSPRDIAHLVPHQTSEATLLSGLERINARLQPDMFPPDRFRINLGERGNTATTTHFMAVRDAIDAGMLQSGDRAAFCITGSGLVIGTALYTFDGLPDRIRGGPARQPGPGAEPRADLSAAPGAPQATVAGFAALHGTAAALESVELCRRVGLECLARAGRPAADVDLLIHSGVYRTNFLVEPAVAALAAGALETNAEPAPGTARRTFAFDLMAGHLGTLKACWVADQTFRRGRYDNAMVLASDVENDAAPGSDTDGENAASALLLAAGGSGLRFEAFHFRDYPEYAGLFESHAVNPDGRPRLVVHRHPEFAQQAARCLVTTATEWLTSMQLSTRSLDAILLPTAPSEMRADVIQIFDIQDRVVMAPASGDVMGSFLAVGLEALVERGLARTGTRVLILAAGAGIQTGCALARFH